MGGIKAQSLKNTMTHPLCRMLPLFNWQRQVYRLAEKKPPAGGMAEHAPSWETVNMVLPALGNLQARINLQRDFWLMALICSSSVFTASGGFRAQFYDSLKKVRFADRGMNFANIAGGARRSFFLRDPYQFDLPDSQVLVIVQNLENAVNTIQFTLYGQVLRFNQ